MKSISRYIHAVINWLKNLSTLQKIIIAGVIVGGLYFIYKSTGSTNEPAYQYAAVERGSIIEMVSETGEIMSSNKTEIDTSITGIVKEVYVENGDQVKRGQQLFYVTSSATEQERAKAYSDYLSAKNNLDTANRNYLIYESDMWAAHETFEADALDTELSVDDPIFIQTERDWQAAEKKYLDQKSVAQQAQVAVSNAWLNYQATIDGPVKATIDGQVANLSVAAGQIVTAIDPALIIVSDADTWVKVAINENDIVTVEPGQKANITIDALDIDLPATVQRVDEFGNVVSDVVIYYVYLTLDETVPELKPGMTTQVDIITQEKSNILVIPNTAIKPYQGEKAVQILDPNTNVVIYKPITTGVSGDIDTEVISGLEEGQQIIVGDSNNSTQSQSGGLFRPPGH